MRYADTGTGPRSSERGGNLDVKKEQTERDKSRSPRARVSVRIGRELRRMYDDVVQEPIPDDFLDLLKKIDEAGKERKQADVKSPARADAGARGDHCLDIRRSRRRIFGTACWN